MTWRTVPFRPYLTAAARPNAKFVRVEAEEADELAERYEVSAVPFFTFHAKGAVVDKLEGADAKALASKAGGSSMISTRPMCSDEPRPRVCVIMLPEGTHGGTPEGQSCGRVRSRFVACS